MMKLLADNISKSFARAGSQQKLFSAVQEASLLLEAGRLIAVKGRSGSGKSTLLNMLSGLLKPDAGHVFFGETELYTLDDAALSRLRNQKIGIIPQGHTALRSLTVLENVILPVRLYEPERDAAKQAQTLLQEVGIGELAQANPAELSGGELRRMAIARALIQNPPVLLADEPTGDLDDENTELVLRLLRKAADAGTAVLLVTHESAAEPYADEVYAMNAGKLQFVL